VIAGILLLTAFALLLDIAVSWREPPPALASEGRGGRAFGGVRQSPGLLHGLPELAFAARASVAL